MVTQRFALLLALLGTACSRAGAPSLPAQPQALPRSASSPIEHVVFVIQENRSFNNLFMGYPGATSAAYGYDAKGNKIALKGRRLWSSWDPGHAADDFFAACDGGGKLPGTDCKMDGWNREKGPPFPPRDLAYSYVPKSEVQQYWDIASQYVLADKMFASNLDGSFVAHQYAVAAYSSRAVNFPATQWGCEGGPTDKVPTITDARRIGPRIRACFDNATLAAEADAAGISWRFYAASALTGGLWSSYQADRKIYYGPDWSANVINPPSHFLRDVKAGKLAQITWITPTWPTSDHPSVDAKYGPQWIASVVDAVGKSKFWKSTAIFIMWDDWGGWFDPVAPVFEDYDGLGFRVPMLIVSPYARNGSVTHVQYETASVVRFIEDNFGLATLSVSDARANDPANDPAAFDYGQTPRKFKTIPGAQSRAYWTGIERWAAQHPPPQSTDGD